MSTKIQNLRRKLQKATLVVAGLLIAATSMVVATPTQQASAAGCRHYDTTAWWWNVAPSASGDSRTWYYGDKVYVPYSSQSSCNDINLRRSSIRQAATDYSPVCSAFRVRYYPGESRSYTSGETLACTGIGDAVIASGASGGRPYRVETTNYVSFHIYD